MAFGDAQTPKQITDANWIEFMVFKYYENDSKSTKNNVYLSYSKKKICLLE